MMWALEEINWPYVYFKNGYKHFLHKSLSTKGIKKTHSPLVTTPVRRIISQMRVISKLRAIGFLIGATVSQD